MRQKPSGDLNTLTPVLKNNIPADVWFHAIRALSSGATSHSLSRLRAEVGRLVMCWCVFWVQTINSHIILGQKRMSQNAFVYQLYAVQLKQEENSYSIVMHTFKQHAHAEFINVLSAFYYLLYWTYTQFLHIYLLLASLHSSNTSKELPPPSFIPTLPVNQRSRKKNGGSSDFKEKKIGGDCWPKAQYQLCDRRHTIHCESCTIHCVKIE